MFDICLTTFLKEEFFKWMKTPRGILARPDLERGFLQA
jgi:hypothetical protein